MAPSPSDLGFDPVRFPDWRPHQWDTIEEIINCNQSVILLQAPPGIGKSLIAMGLLRHTNSKGFIITATRSLQDQYLRDGPFAVTVKGRNNFNCVLPEWRPETAQALGVTPNTKVDSAPCAVGYKCPVKEECPYFIQRDIALANPISIHNYKYWLPESTYGKGFIKADYIVADEGHLLDDECRDFLSAKITHNQLTYVRRYRIHPPDEPHTSKKWDIYAEQVSKLAARKEAEIPEASVEKVRWVRLKNDMENLRRNLADGTHRWVFCPDEQKGITIRPVWLKDIRQNLFSVDKGKKLVIMSATILDPDLYAKVHGLGDFHFIDKPWTFRADSRPILYYPSAKVVKRLYPQVTPTLARTIDHILETRPTEKGLIHTQSYQLGNMVYGRLKNKNRIIPHLTTEVDRGSIISDFKKTLEPKWLMSPSVKHGEDFPYDVARSQIIMKVPFPSLEDPVVRIRLRANPRWYAWITMAELWQMYGRVVRAADDYGESIVLDISFKELVDKYPEFVPDAIREAIVWR